MGTAEVQWEGGKGWGKRKMDTNLSLGRQTTVH